MDFRSDFPKFSEETIFYCDKTHDYMPMVYEWYKYIGQLCKVIASISEKSPGFRKIPPVHFGILIGLLNRCSRLILSSIALATNDFFGETVQIINRCIFESCIKLIWLCRKNSADCFNQYIADGLKSDIEMQKCIDNKISERNDKQQLIEKRMLESIENTIELSELSIDQVILSKKLPSLNNMIDDIYDYDKRLKYVVFQKIASHSTHGTWTDLLKYYIKKDNNSFILQDHNSKVCDIQFLSSSTHVLEALESFLCFITIDSKTIEVFNEVFDSIYTELRKLFLKSNGKDFDTIE